MSLHPLAKLSRLLAVHSKKEVSHDEFTPLSKAEPYIGRIQHNERCQMISLRPLAKLSPILAVYSKIDVSDDEFTPLSKAEPYIGRIQKNRGVT